MVDLSFHIDTPRLVISCLDATQDSHCDFLVTLYNSPDVAHANNGAASPMPNREAARKEIERNDRQWSTGYGRYLVSLKPPVRTSEEAPLPVSQSFPMIGVCSLKLRRFEGAPLVPDVGYGLLSAFQGKGYATEAAGALVRWHEEQGNQKEFMGFTAPDNEGSKAVLKRLGFDEQGVKNIRGIRSDGGVLTASVWSKGLTKSLEAYGISSET